MASPLFYCCRCGLPLRWLELVLVMHNGKFRHADMACMNARERMHAKSAARRGRMRRVP